MRSFDTDFILNTHYFIHVRKKETEVNQVIFSHTQAGVRTKYMECLAYCYMGMNSNK